MHVISLTPMTDDLYHQYFKDFQNDLDLCMDMDKFTPFQYSYEWVETYIHRQKEKKRLVFAIMQEGLTVGEVMLKAIDDEKKECTMSICLQNDQVKGQGIGTMAERLILDYAFSQLGMKTVYADAILKNTRSQHILEKVGFAFAGEDDRFRYYRFDKK